MTDFDSARARAKRPCPIWVDAFQRDTQHLEADEVGAYFLILMAMWTRAECDFPDDDVRLARISRVSSRLWKSRIGPTLRPFFTSKDGALISKRLREEATYTERQCKAQHDRKVGEKTRKPLENNDPYRTADISTDITKEASPDQPTQLPNIRSSSSSSDAGAQPRDPPPDQAPITNVPDEAWALWRAVLKATGVPEECLPTYWMPPAAVIHVQRWMGMGLTEQEIIDTARQTRSNHTDPPKGPKALDGSMQRTAAAKLMPPMMVPEGQKPRFVGGNHVQKSDGAEKMARRADLIKAAARGTT